MNNQEYKADGGKLRVDLVSPAFIKAVASIRTYSVKKYGDYGTCPNCTKSVSDYDDFKICRGCGQALDWSGVE